MNTYIIYSKGDDYGACRTELAEIPYKNAKAYYHCEKVADDDVEILEKYLNVIDPEEEAERTDEDRFYGN